MEEPINPNPAPEKEIVAPAEPVAPIEPAAPVAQTEEEEWDDASKELFPDLAPAEKPKVEEPVKPVEPVIEPAKPVEGADTKAEQPAPATQREVTVELESLQNEIIGKLYKDVPLELKDVDGDPIKTVEDVMKLLDPRTADAENPKGKPFTQESAERALITWRQDLQDKRQGVEKEARSIALTNMKVKEEADAVKAKFGTILDKNPEAAKSLLSQFTKTLKLNGEVIIEAPVSMLEYYTTALAPYAKADAAEAAAAEATKKAEDIQKRQDQADRGDIFGGGQTDNLSDEEKEWAAAQKEVFGK